MMSSLLLLVLACTASASRPRKPACYVSAAHIREKSWPSSGLVLIQPNSLLTSFSSHFGFLSFLFSLKNALVVCLVHSFLLHSYCD